MTNDSSHLPSRLASQSRKVHHIPRDASLNHGGDSETIAQACGQSSEKTRAETDSGADIGDSSIGNSPALANISRGSGITPSDQFVSGTSSDLPGRKSGSTCHQAPRDEAAGRPALSAQEQREARRRKILAKGADRLAYITGDRQLTDIGGISISELLEAQGMGGVYGGEGESNSRSANSCELPGPTSPPPLPTPPTATSADFQPPSGSFTSGVAPSACRQPRGALGLQLPRRSPNPKPPLSKASQTAMEAPPLAAAVAGQFDTWQQLVTSQSVGGNAALSALLEQLKGGQLGPDSAEEGAGVRVEGSHADVAWQFNSSFRQVAGSGTLKLLPAVSQSWDATSEYRTLFTVLYALIVVVAANALAGSFLEGFLQPLLLTWPIGLLILTQGTAVLAGALLAQRGKKAPRNNPGKGLGSSGVPIDTGGVGEGGVRGWGGWEGGQGPTSVSEGTEGDLMRKKMETMIGRIEGGLGWVMLGWKVMCGISLDVSIFLVVVCCGFSILYWVTPGSMRV